MSKSKKFLALPQYGDERYRIECGQTLVDASNYFTECLMMTMHFRLKYCVTTGLSDPTLVYKYLSVTAAVSVSNISYYYHVLPLYSITIVSFNSYQASAGRRGLSRC